ncbi:HEAT repeat domain-containing protein [Kitasatospora sp. NPDC048365]|uniref:HEAT repeat domain-containing protein n=1 Tax=Kitasatospora sp. NPDC048365 TaxID=3364050 RepID=UPI00371F203F
MRTSGIRAFVHRQLDGRLLPYSDRPTLLVDHLDEAAAGVAARTEDPVAVAAVHVYGLIRHDGWTRERLVAAGFTRAVVSAAEATHRHVSGRHRFPAAAARRAHLIDECVRAVSGRLPQTPQERSSDRVWTDLNREGRPDRATVAKLIGDLDSADPETWWYAVGMLPHARSAAAVEPLIAAWERLRPTADDPQAGYAERSGVKYALRASLAAADLELLLRVADHPDAAVRCAAAHALRGVDDERARAAVLRHDLASAGKLLGLAATDPAPVPGADLTARLVGRLSDDDHRHRPGAVAGRPRHKVLDALGRLGDASCLPALTASLGRTDDGHGQIRAERAIEAIGGTEALRRAVLAVLDDPSADPTRAAQLAARLRMAEAIPGLTAVAARADGPIMMAVLSALLGLRARSAVPVLVEVLDRLEPRRSWLRPDLLDTIGRLDPELAVEHFLVAARHRRTHRIALDALARCRDPRATALVTTALLSGASRTALVRPLAERADPDLLDALAHVVATTPDRRVRQVATRGILRTLRVAPDRADSTLRSLAFSSVQARIAAAWLEGRLGPQNQRDPLRRLIEASRSPDPRVRAQAARSFVLLGTPDALDLVRTLCEDPSRHVRACAVGHLTAARPDLRPTG